MRKFCVLAQFVYLGSLVPLPYRVFAHFTLYAVLKAFLIYWKTPLLMYLICLGFIVYCKEVQVV